MTSPTRRIEVECPACGTRYEDDWRPSINLGLGEEWTPEEIEEATSATCPECGRRVALDALVVDGDVWRSPDRAGRRPRLLAVGGAGYLVSVDGTDSAESPSVMYDPVRRRISHEALAAGHLKMLNGYSAPFTGSEEERERVEADVARLLRERDAL